MKSQDRAQTVSGKALWCKRAVCFLLCMLMAMTVVYLPTNSAAAYDTSRYVKKYLNQVYPKVKVVAAAYLVGSDDNPQRLSRCKIQPVDPSTKIQGYTIDPKYMPQDNMENLRQLYDAYGVISGTQLQFPTGCAYLERETAYLQVVAYDREKVIFWSNGYRSFTELTPHDCHASVYFENHSPGFYQIARNEVWLNPGRLQSNVIPENEKNLQPAAIGTVCREKLEIQLRPRSNDIYGKAWVVPKNTKLEVMSTEQVADKNGTSYTYYKIRFDGPNKDNSYFKYGTPGYYYVRAPYVNLDIPSAEPPSQTAVGYTQNIPQNKVAYIHSTPDNTTKDNIVGYTANGVQFTLLPKLNSGKQAAIWFSGKVCYIASSFLKTGTVQPEVKYVENLRVKDIVNNQYVVTWDPVPKATAYRVVLSNAPDQRTMSTLPSSVWCIWKNAAYRQNTLTIDNKMFEKADNYNRIYVLADAIVPNVEPKARSLTLTGVSSKKPADIKDYQIRETGKGKVRTTYLYYYQYATNKSFKNAKTVDSTKSLQELSGFQKNKTYYFRYCKTVKVKTDNGTKKLLGPWSKVYKKKITWKSET